MHTHARTHTRTHTYIYIYIPHAMARATLDIGHEQVLGARSNRDTVISGLEGAP